MLYWNDTFAIEYLCKLHVGHSVSDRYRTFISANPMWKCSFYIVLISPNRHHRRYFLCQSVTKPLWHNRDIVNIGNTATLIEILRCSAIWSMEFPWWNHQKRTVFALWGEPSVTDEFPSQRASNAGLFFCISLDKRLNKRSDCQQFKKIGCALWRYCNVLPDRRQMCIFCSKVTTNPCDKNWFPR